MDSLRPTLVRSTATPSDITTTPRRKSGGVAGPWSAIAGTSGEYWSVSRIFALRSRMEPTVMRRRIGFQYTAGPVAWRSTTNSAVGGGRQPPSTPLAYPDGNGMKVLGNPHPRHRRHVGTAEPRHLCRHHCAELGRGLQLDPRRDRRRSGADNDNEGGAGTAIAATRGHGRTSWVSASTTTGWRTRPSTASTSTIRVPPRHRLRTGTDLGQRDHRYGTTPLVINSTQPLAAGWFAFTRLTA